MFELERVSIRLVDEPPLYSDTPIRCPQDAVALVGDEIQHYDREVICILNISTKGKVINMNVASVGTLNNALAAPREIFKSAILSNAAGVIMMHNHPSGDPTPSKEDITLTSRIIQSGQLIGINLMDHIIVGSGRNYFSFKEDGLCYLEEKSQEFQKLDTTEENKSLKEIKPEIKVKPRCR